MKDFLGKTFFLTGAASGIGKHLSELLYSRNGSIIITDIRTDNIHDYTTSWDECRYMIVQMDVSEKESWRNALNKGLEKFENIDCVINAAGIIEPGYIYNTSFDFIEKTIDVNLKGTMYGSKIFADYFVGRGSGHIINFGSLAALAAVPGLNTYSASKFGVRGFTLAIAQELEEKGVAVSLICPDAVKTKMLDYQKDKIEAALTFSGTRPLSVEEVGKSVLELIRTRNRELWLPTHRGITAVVSTFAPSIAKFLSKMLMQKGMKNQQSW